MKTFDDYINEIDLGDFLKSQGYVLDKNKSAKKPQYGWQVYDLKGQEGKTAETILIKIADDKNPKFKGQFYYYNPNDSRDKGNIIHFIASRNGWNIKENAKDINRYLANYSGAVPPIQNTPKIAPVSKEERNKAVAQYYDLKKLTDRSYLHQRGISDEVIDSSVFKDTICHNEVLKTDGDKQYKFLNTVFPMKTKEGELVGLEIKNNNFHGNAPESQKSNSLWFSNFDSNRALDKIIIGESGIDCLSHYQLKKDDLNDLNVLYLSTGGNLAEGQVALIERLKSTLKPSKGITLMNDNDLAGIRLNIKILGSLNSSTGNNSIKFDLTKQGEYHYQLNVKVYGDEEKISQTLNSIESSFSKYNTEEEKRFSVVHKGITNGEGTIQIDIPSNISNFKTAEKILLKGRVLENEFSIDRPANKDFNDDLKEKLGINSKSKSKGQAKEDNNLLQR